MQPSISLFRGHWDKRMHRPASNDPVVDGVRAIAVLWVLVFHMAFFHFGTFTPEVFGIFTESATAWIARGDLGVDLFFAISGYLMGGILFQEYIKTGGIRFNRFYARRFLRLIPVYTVVMLLGLYMLRNVPKSAVLMDLPASGNAENLWANVLYVNNFLPVAKQYMGWCWSLAIEEQFYLVLVQREMERGRSPLVSIPPFGRGFSRHEGLPIRCGLLEERCSEAAALRSSSQ